MKVLLFGKNGQVGWELNRTLQPLGEIVALGRADADFSAPESLREIVQRVRPDIIVNAVAYTAVDKAEEEEELAAIINAEAPGVLAEEALKLDALLVHYSTDYVFDGTKDGPYVETDVPNPINAYGRTKLAGERAVQAAGCDYLIFRTSWVYAARGHNFLLTILRLAREREELSIVDDQIGSPTSASLIADASSHCLHRVMHEREMGRHDSALYHLTASGRTSWHGFAEAIIESCGQQLDLQLKVKKIEGIPTSDYPTPAGRPHYSLLSGKRLCEKFDLKFQDWKYYLDETVAELAES